MPSSEFARFYESYFGDPYMAWHDGLDEQALLSLTGDERAEAERLLIAGLATGDSRPPTGLAALRSAQAAPLLKQQLAEAEGNTRIQTALALWQIQQWPPAVPILIQALQHAAFWGQRMDAARALAHVPTPASVAALRAALDDPEDLVRSHAADSLLALHNIPDPDPPNQLSIAVMSDDPPTRRTAIDEIERLIAAHGPPAEPPP